MTRFLKVETALIKIHVWRNVEAGVLSRCSTKGTEYILERGSENVKYISDGLQHV